MNRYFDESTGLISLWEGQNGVANPPAPKANAEFTICQPIPPRRSDLPASPAPLRTAPKPSRGLIFGPFYSVCPPLQQAVNHAEKALKLVQELKTEQHAARLELDGYEPSQAEERLATRDDELSAFVESCIEDYRIGGSDGHSAARSIEHYLADRIHDFLKEEFGCALTCCDARESAPTLTFTLAPKTSVTEEPEAPRDASPSAFPDYPDDLEPPSERVYTPTLVRRD